MDATTATSVARFQARAAEHPHRSLWHEPDLSGPVPVWIPITWGEALRRVEEIAAGLIEIGVQPGDRVALIGKNSANWVSTDYAIQHAGAISVPLYTTFASEQIEYVLGHSGARYYFLDDDAQAERISHLELPSVERVIAFHHDEHEEGRVLGLGALRRIGAEALASDRGPLEARMAGVATEDLFSLIYTSGTTGPPKGTMLTHHNLLWTSKAAADRIDLSGHQTMLSYLPLSHVFERLATTGLPLIEMDGTVEYYFVPDTAMILDALTAARPTLMIAVPRVWEKFRARIVAAAEEDKRKAPIVRWAVDAGIKAGQARDRGESPGLTTRLGAGVAAKVVGKRVKHEMGLDRLTYAISGAAPLASEVQYFFQALGVPLHQGWGMTETTAGSTLQSRSDMEAGVVGPPFEGVEVRLDTDGEILVKGENIFQGYYNEPEKTKEALQEDGWLRTGDIGAVIHGNRLKIVDRKKDIIITAGGKNIPPQEIEKHLKAYPLIGEAMVVGDAKPYLGALISVDADEAVTWLSHQGQVVALEDVYTNPAVLEYVDKAVTEVNERFSRAESLRKWKVLDGGFPEEALTPTLKLKRRVINDVFAGEIEQLYA